jgi:hypothetical protein
MKGQTNSKILERLEMSPALELLMEYETFGLWCWWLPARWAAWIIRRKMNRKLNALAEGLAMEKKLITDKKLSRI